MSLPAAARQHLYASYQELGRKLRAKETARHEAQRTVQRIDSEIAELVRERKEIRDHASASGEDFEAVEQEQHMMQAMGWAGKEYDPIAGGW